MEENLPQTDELDEIIQNSSNEVCPDCGGMILARFVLTDNEHPIEVVPEHFC